MTIAQRKPVPAFDVAAIRRDFPILAREVYGKPLVYLDNAASAQKPNAVLDAMTRSYTEGGDRLSLRDVHGVFR